MKDLSAEDIRKILRTNNKFWSKMYFDSLEDLGHCQVSLLHGADRLYYNAAHTLERFDKGAIVEIERCFDKHRISPGIYTDPASPQNAQEKLYECGYEPELQETEYWYEYHVKDLTKDSPKDYIKIPYHEYSVSIFEPKEGHLFNQFMTVNAIANQLSETLLLRLRQRLLSKERDFKIYLMVCFVKGIAASTKALAIIDGMGFTAEAGTLPEFQRKGLATALVWETVSLANKEHVKKIYVNCDASAYSNQVHQKFGYKSLFNREYFKKTK